MLSCPLVITSTGGGYLGVEEYVVVGDPGSFISRTRLRTLGMVLNGGAMGQLASLRRIPLTGDEVTDRRQFKYELDEGKAVALLAAKGSISGGLFGSWNLTRDVLGNAFRQLCYSRKCQTNLRSIVCATRLKYFEAGGGLCLRSVRIPPAQNRDVATTWTIC